MKLASLKRSKEEQKPMDIPCCADGEQPDYPWGTRLSLGDEELAKLGLTELPAAGTPVAISAMGMIVSTSEDTVDGGKPNRRCEIQITDLAVSQPGIPLSDRMYPQKKA